MQHHRIAIITTHHYPNHGNKLQNYALQTKLTQLGWNVETISDARFYRDMRSWWANRKALIHFIIRFRSNQVHIKTTKFFFWSKRYIKYAPITIHNEKDIERIISRYDYFVVGSDQIWNPEWPEFSNPFGFAMFANKAQKVAYAPSFGITNMISERKAEYCKYLSDWKALSCREYEGVKIIQELTGHTAPVVVDPTLLLSANDWDRIAVNPHKRKPYSALYMIGDVTEQYKQTVQRLSCENGLTLTNIGGSVNYEKGISPGEFIGLIKNASLLFTDSFHGCVFALIYHIPIVIFEKVSEGQQSKSSRIRTLFSHANISSCDFSKPINDLRNLNWREVDANIDAKRNESITFLKQNLT